jgi:hypothetical protein
MERRHSRRWRKVAGLVLGLTAATSCSDKCVGDLAVVGVSCRATFDGTAQSLPACPTAAVGFRCGGLLEVDPFGQDQGGIRCYYDPVSHRLVGAVEYTDVQVLCGDSFTKSAGRTPSVACLGTDGRVQRQCGGAAPPDGGADS